MTVQTSTNVASFNGDGANKVFPIGYKFNSAADLVVTLIDDEAKTTQILTLNSDFTVAGAGDEEGGVVTLVVAPTAVQRLKVTRVVDILQLTDLRNQGKFFAEVHEDAFDLLTMIAQQHQSDIARSLRVAETDPEPARIPSAVQRAGKLLAFDSAGNPTTTLPIADSSTELRQELAEGDGSLVGWMRTALSAQISSVAGALSANTISPWEYASLITDKPDPLLPSTWDWAPAIQAVVDATPSGGLVDLRGLTGKCSRVVVAKPLTIKNANIEAHTSTDTAVIHIVGTEDVTVERVNVIVDYPVKTFTSANVSGIQADTSNNIKIVYCDGIGSKNADYGASSWGCVIHAFNSSNVSIVRCTARNADKEGIMTRQCDNVVISHCKAYDCGYSGVGTSRGINPRVMFCESYNSGSSSISVNGEGYLVSGCIVAGNTSQNGITIGHSDDNQQWSKTGVCFGNTIKSSAGWGILVADPTNGNVYGNTIEDCALGGCIVTAAAGNAPAGATIRFEGNICRTLGGHGFRSTLNGDHHIINNLFDGITGSSQHGLFTDSARLNKIQGNVFRNVSGCAIYSGHLSGDAAAHSEIYDNRTDNVGQSAVVVLGGQSFKVSRNELKAFNTSAAASETAILIQPVAAGHALEGEIDDNTMQGTHGATATSAVYITGTPAGAGTRSLRVDNNRCQSASVLVGGAPSNFDKVSLKSNRIGSSATEVSISVPASSALVVTNSNVQELGNWPQFVPLNQHFGQCYIETYSNGSMTIRNLAASAATARAVW